MGLSELIANKQADLAKQNSPIRLVNVPIDGKVIEPLIGRCRAVATFPDGKPNWKEPRTNDDAKYEEGGLPFSQPAQSMTLEILAMEHVQIGVRIREDLPASVAKLYTKTKPYIAKWGSLHDDLRRVIKPRWTKHFKSGQVVQLPFEQAVFLLRDNKHSRFLEEAPQPVEDHEEDI